MRNIAEIAAMTLNGDRLAGTMLGHTAADWLTVSAGVATIDVRATIQTVDGAVVYVQYRGRTDASRGIGAAPIYVTPLFETGDERYAWLNHVVAVGRGLLQESSYEWFEIR